MLKLYNTMSRSKELFVPLEPEKVKIFACGPSVYQRPHIGNYITFLYEDLLIKYLKYSGYQVNHVIILTDIEDKSFSEAKKKHKDVSSLTGDVAEKFFQEAKQLNIDLPSQVPRSSTSVKESVSLIKSLMKKGYAYKYKGNVFFDPLKFKGFGKLFRLDMSRWPKKKVRFKKDTYNGRRWNLGDFILWHGHQDKDIASWDSDIGRGRPSWNIQDPAVIVKHLGYQVDINCGGIDNIYRHHDYTIAIIESISGKTYANYYLHGEHLVVNGRSMSKSRGNIRYPEDMLKNKYQPYHLRFFLLYRHYRKKLNLTGEAYKRNSSYLDEIRALVIDLIKKSNANKSFSPEADKLTDRIKEEFEKYMNDDLGFGSAVDGIYVILKDLKSLQDKLNIKNISRLEKVLHEIDAVLGILFG